MKFSLCCSAQTETHRWFKLLDGEITTTVRAYSFRNFQSEQTPNGFLSQGGLAFLVVSAARDSKRDQPKISHARMGEEENNPQWKPAFFFFFSSV